MRNFTFGLPRRWQRFIGKAFFSLLLLWFSVFGVKAQVSGYTFATSTETYSSITGGTVIRDGTLTLDSYTSGAITIPAFSLGGVSYTTAYITSNGLLNLGGTAPSTTAYTAISTNTGSGISICPFNADLNRATTTATTELRWQDLTATSNEIVFQWKQFQRYLATESFDMQVRLNTVTGSVKFIYQLNSGPGTSTSYQPQVGIRTSTTDYNNRLVGSGTEDWGTSLAGAANTSVCRFTSTSPAKGFTSGLTYTFTPPPACSGTPTAGSSALTNYNICQGSTQVLAITGASPFSQGITYQWEQSADGTTGWANVIGGTGATTTSYTTAAFSGTTIYYRMKTTCTNSSSSVTTPVITVNGPAIPATQASAFTTTALGPYTATLSWTNGNGNNRSVFVNTTNSFTDPVSPASPGTAATLYANTGQQLVYDGTGTSVAITGLSAGTNYYVRVYENQKCTTPAAWYYNVTTGTNNPGTFLTPVPPANDECSTAVTLTSQPYVAAGTCPSAVSGTTVGATLSSATAPPTTAFSSSQDDDVWYQFTATQTAHLIRLCNVTFPSGTAVSMGVAVTNGCLSTNTEITGSPTGSLITLTAGSGEMSFSGLTVGTVYKVRVLTNGTTSRANFEISVLDPQPMTFVSSTTTQSSSASLVAGSVNQQIIRAAVVVTGGTSPLSVTQLDFNTNGSTNPADITNAKVYYTGISTTFSSTNQFGTTAVSPSGAFSVTGSQELIGGFANTTNYFWLVYDIECGATATNVVDAECTAVYVGGAQTPTVTAPTGTRAITAATYTAVTSQPSTASVLQGAVNAQILRVTLTGCSNKEVTQINFSTTGSTNAGSDIVAARVYYTTTTTFATTTQFGTDVANPNGAFTVTGTQPLTTGTGYFWLVYDLSPTATVANVIDASCVDATINGVVAVPATPNPTGTRTIAAQILNDEASGATTLTVGAGCTTNPYDNTNATQSVNEPFPSCKGTAGYAGMWYKFVAPASGAVKVSCDGTGTLGDSRISLFSATNASDYATFTNIACDDDNGVTGTTRSLLYATGLTSGTTYYVLVDLYSATAVKGTYCVTVDELSSSMLTTTAGSCVADQASVGSYNAAYSGWITLLDASGNLNALVRQTAGTAVSFSSSRTITTGASRVDASGTAYLNRNFLINGSGATSAEVQLFFTDAELASLGGTLAGLNVSRVAGTTCVANYPGGATFLGQTGSGSGGGVSWVKVTTPGFSNFFIHQGNAALPISLVYFNGTKSATANNLNWKVNCTSVSVSFEIERSSNGRNFTSIGALNATQARCLTPFDFADTKPLAGVNYYRIKIIDVDGKVNYTNVVAINNKKSGIELIGIQPTLVNSEAVLYIAAAKAGKLQIAVTDNVGRQVQTRTITVVEGDNKVSLNFGNLAAGVYNLSSINESTKSTIRFVKQ